MPISSAQIAQMNAGFMQQHMSSMMYAGMVGQGLAAPAFDQGQAAEQFAAGTMNKMSGIGAPLAMGGLTLMGLDPLSAGIRGGIGAYGMGMGAGGAALAGAGVATGAGLGLAAVGYMGNQMMAGAQQRQQFAGGMRGGYNFWNPSNVSGGGRGFNRGDISQIGDQLRSMSEASMEMGGYFGFQGTGQKGVSFQELGRLATRMGRLGMAQGVRDAKEFNEKFREMLKTVKGIAEDFGTTLEEAQTTMASMRQSGIFKGQAGVSSRIREASIGGGLAATEVTGMMNVGSQISRMFGGRGRQGALGGIETIAQIGTAQQMGVLSEEDVYNATGLTGAEGRRAMGQQMMMQTGRFLRSGKGRYFLASVAGRGGELDPESVSEWMTGGMTVGRTRAQANRNLRGVGRANFIRNEGRLRGAVMQQFGGLAPAMAMQQWATGRGIDINTMGDREMLFMQRQLGLGRDEADAMVRMARRLPEIMQERRSRSEEDRGLTMEKQRRLQTGFEGMKRRLENTRDRLNSEMQKAGGRIYEGLAGMVEEWGNRTMGVVEERTMSGIRDLWESASMGNERAAAQLGLGPGAGRIMSGDVSTRAWQVQNRTRRQQYMQGGVDLATGSVNSASLAQERQRIFRDDVQFAAQLAEFRPPQMSPVASRFIQNLSESDIATMRREFASVGAGVEGMERGALARRMVGLVGGQGGEGGIRARMTARELARMTPQQRAAFATTLEERIGIPPEQRTSQAFGEAGVAGYRGRGEGIDYGAGGMPWQQVARARFGPTTEAGRQQERGRFLLGRKGFGEFGAGDLRTQTGGMLGSMAGGGLAATALGLGFAAPIQAIMMGQRMWKGQGLMEAGAGALKDIVGGASIMGMRLGERITGEGEVMQGASQWLEENRGDVLGVMRGDRGALESMENERMRLLGMKKLTERDQGALRMTGIGLAYADMRRIATARGGMNRMTDKDWGEILNEAKRRATAEGRDPDTVTLDSLKRDLGSFDSAGQAEQSAVIRKLSGQVGQTSRDRSKELRVAGVAEMKDGRLTVTGATAEKLASKGAAGQEALQALEMAVAAEGVGAGLTGAEGAEERDAASLEEVRAQQSQFWETMSGMSVEGLRELGRSAAGTAPGAAASYLLQRSRRMEARRRKAARRGGGKGRAAIETITGELGLALGGEQLKELAGLDDTKKASAVMMQQLGIQNEDFRAKVEEALTTMKGGTGLTGQAASTKAAGLLRQAETGLSPEERETMRRAREGESPMDRLGDKLAKEIGKGNRYLEEVAKTLGVEKSILSQISGKLSEKDGEK